MCGDSECFSSHVTIAVLTAPSVVKDGGSVLYVSVCGPVSHNIGERIRQGRCRCMVCTLEIDLNSQAQTKMIYGPQRFVESTQPPPPPPPTQDSSQAINQTSPPTQDSSQAINPTSPPTQDSSQDINPALTPPQTYATSHSPNTPADLLDFPKP